MKNKVLKIIFIASFLPYLLALIVGINSAFSGISFFFSTIYGLDAFLLGLISALYSFVFLIPIIPVCLFFQICYILRHKIKSFKNIKLKKYVRICCIVGIFLVLALIVYSYSFDLKMIMEKVSAKQMIKNAEEQIGFNKSDISIGGIFDIPEYEYSHVLIDYDEVEVGMLLNADFDQFWKVKLQEISKDSPKYQHIVNDYFLQANIPLNSPGKQLLSFYKENSESHRTIAFLLIYDDGTTYYADNIKEKDTGFTRFTGLQWSEFFVGENIKFKE